MPLDDTFSIIYNIIIQFSPRKSEHINVKNGMEIINGTYILN